MQDIMKRIYDYTLEDIMSNSFIRYSKAIIQDRALPDVRDGLKPVQRRILYSMYKEKKTYEKGYRKSAETVGNVLGTFHPHGDSSVYEAMVRMSQTWKQNVLLIDMQGNNGSMDGDGPAAMRYTESKLTKISNELLKDIDKDTVMWAPNYSDTCLEPTVLPAKFPNLLVNGCSGISAGYATSIPPHNLGEVIDATLKRLDEPECSLDSLLEIVKGPDFPTGAIVEGKDGIIDAYQTGRGKIVLRAKTEFVKNKGKEQIIVTEIPYDVNKAALVKKINDIRLDKKIDGIIDARDESDKDGLTIAIDVKKEANKELILNYLLKNTELQISYNYNMVAIVNRRPMTLGLVPILDAYIAHQKEVITRRANFELKHFKSQYHITEGLIKALSILDQVIATIRSSKDKQDAKINLVKEYQFTEEQAEAIVTLQLYRLTNFDILELTEKNKSFIKLIKELEDILKYPEKLKNVIKGEMLRIKEEYATPRKTEIKDTITEIKIETTSMIPKEDVIVVVTKEGYVKRTSLRSFNSNDEEALVKENDYIIGKYQMNTLDTILLFTDLGNYLYVPVYELPDLKWKELGKHISNIIKILPEENVIESIPVYDFDNKDIITIFTKDGLVKRTSIDEFKVQRYSKPMTAIKLKENDLVVSVVSENKKNVFITTHNGYGLTYLTEEIPVTGIKSSGVKSIGLKNDIVVSGHLYDELDDTLVVVTNKNTAKRVKLKEFELTARARKGVLVVRDVKTNPYYILRTFIISSKSVLGLKSKMEINNLKITELPISDRYSTGSTISKQDLVDVFVIQGLVKNSENNNENNTETTNEEEVENISLDEIDKKILTIDDFLDDFKLNE